MAVNENVPLNVMDNNDRMPLTISKAWQPEIVPETTLRPTQYNATFCQVWVQNVDTTTEPAGYTGVVVVWDGKSLHTSGTHIGKPLVSTLQFRKNSLSVKHNFKGAMVLDEGYDLNNQEQRTCPVLAATTLGDMEEPHIVVGGAFN